MSRDERSISASREIDAPPSAIFEVLTDPSLHPVIDGSGSVRQVMWGADRLTGIGDAWWMAMLIGVPYVIRNVVVEFERDRLIAWRHVGRHRWRYELEPLGDGDRTRVTETFDWSTALSRRYIEWFKWPERHAPAMAATLERLDELVAGRA